MAYTLPTIKKLFARSSNECAMPKCEAPIIIGETVVGEICHIRARRKNGPRYDPNLSLKERNDYPNLLLLCATCHKLIDRNESTYSIDLLTEIKEMQDREGSLELSLNEQKSALALHDHYSPKKRTSAKSSGDGIAVAIGRDNYGDIHITQKKQKTETSKYPKNSIGADANLCGYIDYLFSKGIDYWKNIDGMNAGRLGKKIKRHFRLNQKTRNHLTVDRFEELASFIIHEIIEPSPVGKSKLRKGEKLCRTFEEFRFGNLG